LFWINIFAPKCCKYYISLFSSYLVFNVSICTEFVYFNAWNVTKSDNLAGIFVNVTNIWVKRLSLSAIEI
jgi:hypothetical protein